MSAMDACRCFVYYPGFHRLLMTDPLLIVIPSLHDLFSNRTLALPPTITSLFPSLTSPPLAPYLTRAPLACPTSLLVLNVMHCSISIPGICNYC